MRRKNSATSPLNRFSSFHGATTLPSILAPMNTVVVALFLAFSAGIIPSVYAQTPTPTVVDSPTVKVLTGLLAPQFQEEMNLITQALGVTCGTCHAPRGNFASREKERV